MFIVDTQSNRISPVKTQRFSDLGFTERHHLQEWLAYEPSALGEELLIIQKEFDGFDDTRERLDLLALDKLGNLVIIENKLDDSGRDVVWQAIKYASYCATLTKQQIVDIYQQYIQRYLLTTSTNPSMVEPPRDAATRISEFLDAPDLSEVKLNSGTGQRIILVAAHFRKEVTSTALWLLERGISIQCFKVTPYTLADQLLISVDQIIPPPETRELMISISAKEAEEKNAEHVIQDRYNVRRAYWTQLLETFQTNGCTLYRNVSASKDHWLNVGSGVSGCPYGLLFLQKALRVQIAIERSGFEENKMIFDQLYQHKAEIEARFGHALHWSRLDDKISCRIDYEVEADGYQQELWPQWTDWHLKHITQLEKAFKPVLSQVVDAVKKQLAQSLTTSSFAQDQ